MQTLPVIASGRSPSAASPTPAQTARDLAVVVLLVALVVAIGLHAPSNLYAYAQHKRIGTATSMLRTGDYLLPRNQTGRLPSKPQLYPWLAAAAIRLTGTRGDFVFRLPTILASLATGAVVYLLGRRWYGRGVGLLAACFWATALHMGKMATLAATDMLLTLWVTLSLLCADRLLFHRAPRRGRWKWAVGLWLTMVLGALTKGWGVVNLALVGGTLALAGAFTGGFGALRWASSPARKALLAARLVLRRWRRVLKAIHFGWGVLALAAALVPLWIVMFLRGGQEFRELIYFEIFQRITGAGEQAPKQSSLPAVVHLLYYLLPASVFAIGGLVMSAQDARARRDGAARAKWPFVLPLAWLVAVVLPFSLTHGFRPDYLLPCYAAAALMAAWAVERLCWRAGKPSAAVRVFGGVFAAAALGTALTAAATAGGFVFRHRFGRAVERALPMPAAFAPETRWVLYALIPLGAAGAVLAVVWSVRWRPRRVAAVAMAGMLAVIFCHTHVLSRHARTGDGEKMIDFARRARSHVGGDELAVYRASKLLAEPYLGRLGVRVGDVAGLNAARPRWLITCDRGLAELGACRRAADGPYLVKAIERTDRGPAHVRVRLRTLPEELGEVIVRGEPVVSQNWGRAYLIRLRRPVRVSGRPLRLAWVSGRRNDE